MQAQETSDSAAALRHFSAGEKAAQAAMNADVDAEIGPLFWCAVCRLEAARLRGKVATLRGTRRLRARFAARRRHRHNVPFRGRAARSRTNHAPKAVDSRRRSRTIAGAVQKRAETFPRQFNHATLLRRSAFGRQAAQQNAARFAGNRRGAARRSVALGTGTRPVARAFRYWKRRKDRNPLFSPSIFL